MMAVVELTKESVSNITRNSCDKRNRVFVMKTKVVPRL